MSIKTLAPIKPIVELSSTIPVTVDYLTPLPEMVQKGEYERNQPLLALLIEQGIKPYTYVKGPRKYEMKFLTTPKKYLKTAQILKAIDDLDPQHPWKPARIEHLLALGAQYPQKQTSGQIIALGTLIMYQKEVHFARLEFLHNQRGVSIINDDGVWKMTDRFLIFRPL